MSCFYQIKVSNCSYWQNQCFEAWKGLTVSSSISIYEIVPTRWLIDIYIYIYSVLDASTSNTRLGRESHIYTCDCVIGIILPTKLNITLDYALRMTQNNCELPSWILLMRQTCCLTVRIDCTAIASRVHIIKYTHIFTHSVYYSFFLSGRFLTPSFIFLYQFCIFYE